MMACLEILGLWLFIILTGVSYSLPMKKDSQEVPASGFTDASVASGQDLKNAPPQLAGYAQHGARMSPTPALYNANAFAAPVYLAYDGIAPHSGFQGSSSEDGWTIKPPGPFSGVTPPQNLRLPLRPEHGPGYARQSLPFKSGEAYIVGKEYDRGNYNSQTEEQGLLFPYGPIRAPTRYPVSSFLNLGPPVGGLWFGYPNDYMMLQAPIPSDWNPPVILKT